MLARLRVLHGTLQDKQHHNTRPEVKIRGPRFVIGSAPDCAMCCRSDSVGLYHCEIRIEPQGVVVHARSRDLGTFVNGERVPHERVLQAGDHLRVGRLEFEVLIDDAAPIDQPRPTYDSESRDDAVAEQITESLSAADERDRLYRLGNPELRRLELKSASPEAAPAPTAEEEAEKQKAKKKAPLRLPRPPAEPAAKDSTEAAQLALKRLFSR